MKRTIITSTAVLATVAYLVWHTIMVAAQDVTTWATPVPEPGGASELARLIAAIIIDIILRLLGGA